MEIKCTQNLDNNLSLCRKTVCAQVWHVQEAKVREFG